MHFNDAATGRSLFKYTRTSFSVPFEPLRVKPNSILRNFKEILHRFIVFIELGACYCFSLVSFCNAFLCEKLFICNASNPYASTANAPCLVFICCFLSSLLLFGWKYRYLRWVFLFCQIEPTSNHSSSSRFHCFAIVCSRQRCRTWTRLNSYHRIRGSSMKIKRTSNYYQMQKTL